MIHIKRTGAMGDVIWVEPIVRHFINEGHCVNIETRFPEIFENYPSDHLWINEPIFTLEKKREKAATQYYMDLDMAYETRPKMHILEAYQKEAGIEVMPLAYPQLHLTTEEKIPLFTQDYVALHLEKQKLHYRNAYGVDWKEVVHYLENLGFVVMQISSSGNDLYGKWVKLDNLRKMMSLLYHSKLFIGIDSGPSHIAASFEIPSILFFGSVNPSFRHLPSFNGIFLQGACEYAHCYHEVVSTQGQMCRWAKEKKYPPCSLHSTQSVLSAIKTLMSQKVSVTL